MSESQIDLDKIRKRVDKRLDAQIEFRIHLVSYIAVNVGGWAIWFLTRNVFEWWGNFPWPLLMTLSWGIGLVIHWAYTYFNARMDAERDRMLRREIELEQMRLGLKSTDIPLEKPKREGVARLTDDGELAYEEEAPRRQRRSK